jgi:hypothetical protein
MHPVSASRWTQLAASRLPIDLTEEESSDRAPRKGRMGRKGRRRRDEHADIQAQVDAIAAKRISAIR